MTITDVQRTLLWTGSTGTLVLVLVIAGRGLSQSGPPPLAIALGAPVIVILMLSPYWGIFRQLRRPSGTQAEAYVLLAASVLVVALGAYAYLAGWVFYTGPTRTTGQGMLAVIVPLYQWVIVGVAAGLRWMVRTVSRRLEQGRMK